MNARERILAAINFQPLDKVPYMHSLTPSAWKYGRELLNILNGHPDDFRETPYTEVDIQKPDPKDFKNGQYYKIEKDEWGCTRLFRNFGIGGMVMEPFVFSDENFLRTYRPPLPPFLDSNDPGFIKEREHQLKYRTDHYAVTQFRPTFERMHYLRGYEHLLLDIAAGDPFVEELLDMVVEYNMGWIQWAIATSAEAIIFSDDWGTQDRLMIRPEVWRKVFKPRYKKMFDAVRAGGLDIWFHSCGFITEIFPDLAEIGVKVLWPQFSCYNLREFAAQLRELKIAVLADFDRQKILPFGTPDEVDKYIKESLDIFRAKEGGFIGRAELSGDMPIENIRALCAAFWKYGRGGE
ncbi:MAG: uroporphyrinogen decarboxylase family protein [Candidatus Omnitrophota bacterium]